MTRCLAFIFALMLATLSVASACSASGPNWVRFTLQQERDSNQIRASFEQDRGHGAGNWSTGFMPHQITGLDTAGFRATGTRPLRFAVIREPGRLDCSGQGGNSQATGDCRFTADNAFAQLLDSRGIGQPTNDEAFSLMAVNARRKLIDAIAQAKYPTPRIDDLVSLAALDVTADYIRGLATAGYRPEKIDTLVEFKALGITPAYIAGFTKIGYRNIDPDDLVQLKALNVTPEYIAGFQKLGYTNLSADRLVELKAVGITPEFVAAVREPGSTPAVSDLVDRKFGARRR